MVNSRRKERIGQQIQRELGMVLLSSYPKESIFNKVTITAVDVAPDLSMAKVFFSLFDEAEFKNAKKTLQDEASFLRKLLARNLNLRITPRLNFLYDESIERGAKLSRLIDSGL